MANNRQSKKSSFEKKFIVTPGCWLWTAGTRGSREYGSFWMDGRNHRAHRVSYELYVAAIPQGMHVLHKCDCTRCVNPDHLFIGTHLENMHDMVKKGRFVRASRGGSSPGEKHYASKLSDEKVLSIRQDTRNNVTIAAEMGVSNALIGMVKARKIWRHLP